MKAWIAAAAGAAAMAAAGPERAPTRPGAAAYARVCAACHGASGEGGEGPAFTRGLDPAAVAFVVRNGLGRMPPAADRLTPAEIDAVARYVAGLRR